MIFTIIYSLVIIALMVALFILGNSPEVDSTDDNNDKEVYHNEE